MLRYLLRTGDILHTVNLVSMIVVCIVLVSTYEAESRRTSPKHRSSSGYTSRNIPLFRPLRRTIKNAAPDRTSTITLVFQSVMPRIRWFRSTGHNTLPNSEMTDMINIEGDPQFKIRIISSYDITAVTLTIKPTYKIPVKFTTCFSVDEVPFQYLLETYINDLFTNETTALDGLIWISTPPPTVTFNENGQLTVSCTVRFDSESLRVTDELLIYKSYLDRKHANKAGVAQLMSAGCARIHKDREGYTEEAGKYISSGRRVTTPGAKSGPVTYEVSFKVLNGSQDDVGVYTCAAEREKDRTYISSWVRLTQPSIPVMIFVACEGGTSEVTPLPENRKQYTVVLTETQQPKDPHVERMMTPTCVRCRAYDYRSSLVELTKNGVSVQRSTQFMILDWHLNVADGGLSELTITFLRPTDQDRGQYVCSIANESGTDSVTFNIAIARDESDDWS